MKERGREEKAFNLLCDKGYGDYRRLVSFYYIEDSMVVVDLKKKNSR